MKAFAFGMTRPPGKDIGDLGFGAASEALAALTLFDLRISKADIKGGVISIHVF